MSIRRAPLGDLCRFVGGGTPSRKKPEYFGGEIPWATVKDFKSLRISDTEEAITDQAIIDSATNVVEAGTVLLVTRVGLGKVALAGRRLAINQDIKGLTPNAQVLPEFLFWFLLSKANDIQRMGVGATVKGVTLQDIRAIEMPVPPLDQQRRVVDLLSRAEGIVRLRQEARKKAQAIIPALFLDMFGDPATNSKHLPTDRLDSLCTLVRGSSPRPQGDARFFGGPVPRLMISDITRDGTYVTPRVDSLTEEGARKSRPMKRGEVVMAVSGAVGLPAILAVDACIHDGFVGFRSLSREITPEFFYNYLIALRHFSQTQAVGATFQNLKTEQIRAWQVLKPSAAAQQRFSALAESALAIEIQQAAAVDKSDAMFHSFLAQAFLSESSAAMGAREEIAA